MEISKNFNIEEKLYKEFLDYCLLNDIQDSNKEFIRMFVTGFNISKYGISPFKNKPVVKDIKPEKEKEVIKTEEINEKPSLTNDDDTKPKKRVRIIKNKN